MKKTVGIDYLGCQNHCICNVSSSVSRGACIENKKKSDAGRKRK